jgi:hypothetical protein
MSSHAELQGTPSISVAGFTHSKQRGASNDVGMRPSGLVMMRAARRRVGELWPKATLFPGVQAGSELAQRQFCWAWAVRVRANNVVRRKISARTRVDAELIVAR